ncbi:MAG TPA: hypothetical protein DCY48_00865 [Candidatus Magasanikbacteria bacterium]|nr:MAG: hypothetical protein A3I74_02475 [Candidatus Magasanikbacteria bacterium RIFCSPLOWO2_02_FULL_47_16]OGH79626.1 MAG: hypothetical protein A3C10_00925 [Candidatus Magasanikbacteria bacterium RIFCSPHIGHO2_02_FULL_48_18]HAZ28312.1 hypothetical protein [Candidatus Magasanikbacteria bacterium]
MPIPHLQRRTYGYTDPEKKKQTRIYGEEQPEPRPKISRRRRSKTIFWWFGLPFLITWRILSFLFGLWKKHPRLKKQTKRALRRRVLRAAVILTIVGFIVGTGLVAWISRDLPDPDRLSDINIAQSTKIYDRTGEHLLYEIFAKEKRTIVEMDQIPQYLIDAVVATEDKKFFEHRGVRPLSMIRAVAQGIFTRKRISATSTLTQQLVKNVILTDERSLQRKIKEIILAIRLEQKYTKTQILKIYFNAIPYGSTNYGVEAAAQSYFGKHVKDITLSEAATLAGLPKAPTSYLNNPDALIRRRNFVLFRMEEERYITKGQKEAAQQEPLEIKQRYDNIDAPHFVLYVRELLVKEFGEQLVDTGGLKVQTTLNWDLQHIAETVMEETGNIVLPEAGANNSALVAIDPKTGEVLAMIGSKDFFDESIDGQFNVAAHGKRQPGSSFKPVIYAAAFEKGYTPETVLFDVATNFAVSGKPYKPLNFDLQERGPVTIRQALQGSLNIPAVKTFYLVGEKNGIDFAKRLGYTTFDEGNFGLSLVLGGGEVRLIEHVNAFATFANYGMHHEPTTILRVENAKGDTLKEWKNKKGERVLDPNIAKTITNILSDDPARAYIFGAGGMLTLPGRPVAAKTGTTNNYVDAWTVGYTPSLAAGVWAGNTNNSPMKKGHGGNRVAGELWNAFMKQALANTPVESFEPPTPSNTDKPVLKGNSGGAITLLVDKVTGKIATSSTPEKYLVEKTYIQPHSILHYVNKDDPQGPLPEDPAQDSQYAGWEMAIQEWIARKKEKEPDWDLSFEEPPTEYDDLHSLELIPTLTVISPAPGTSFSTRHIEARIEVSAPRGVSRVLYKLDNTFIAVVDEHPFALSYEADTIESGEHTLTIIVEDDVGNHVEETVPILFDVGTLIPSVSWSVPIDTLAVNQFPITLSLVPTKTEDIIAVSVFFQPSDGSGEKKLLYTTNDLANLFNNQIAFVWPDAPAPGSWSLTTQINLKEGAVLSGDSHTIIVKE